MSFVQGVYQGQAFDAVSLLVEGFKISLDLIY